MRARPRRRSAVVWGVLAVLLAVIGLLEYRERGEGPDAAPPSDPRTLLPVPAAELGALEISNRGQLHRFERDASGGWFYHGVHTAATGDHTHAAAPELSERIERAVAALGRARSEREFELVGDGAGYGLTAPEMIILVYAPDRSRPLAQFVVGALAPDTVSRYLMVVGHRRVLTIPGYQIDNLLGLIQAATAQPDPGVARTR